MSNESAKKTADFQFNEFTQIKALEVEDSTIFVVTVKRTGNIHSYKNIAYKRVGSHDKPLSPEELIEFAKSTGKIQFDSQICEEAVYDGIDEEKVLKRQQST